MLQSIPKRQGYPLSSGTSSLKKKKKYPAVAYGELLKASGASSDLFQEALPSGRQTGRCFADTVTVERGAWWRITVVTQSHSDLGQNFGCPKEEEGGGADVRAINRINWIQGREERSDGIGSDSKLTVKSVTSGTETTWQFEVAATYPVRECRVKDTPFNHKTPCTVYLFTNMASFQPLNKSQTSSEPTPFPEIPTWYHAPYEHSKIFLECIEKQLPLGRGLITNTLYSSRVQTL